MKFFGVSQFHYDWDQPPVETPVGALCAHCGEPIAKDDGGCLLPYIGEPNEPSELAYHHACFMRSTIGSVAHQQRRCFCFGGTGEDDPALTTRQAAEAAATYFYRVNQ